MIKVKSRVENAAFTLLYIITEFLVLILSKPVDYVTTFECERNVTALVVNVHDFCRDES